MTSSTRAVAVGLATGLRSTTGPAVAFRGVGRGRILALFVLGELIVDKLPQTPARTTPLALVPRIAGAAIAAGRVADEYGGDRFAAASLAVLAAVGAAYAGVAYRRRAAGFVPDWLAAVLEDGLAIGLAYAATR